MSINSVFSTPCFFKVNLYLMGLVTDFPIVVGTCKKSYFKPYPDTGIGQTELKGVGIRPLCTTTNNNLLCVSTLTSATLQLKLI